jgi:hypothetical protein
VDEARRKNVTNKMGNVNGVNASERDMLEKRRTLWLYIEFTENRKMIRG